MNLVQLHRAKTDGVLPDYLVLELVPGFVRHDGNNAEGSSNLVGKNSPLALAIIGFGMPKFFASHVRSSCCIISIGKSSPCAG